MDKEQEKIIIKSFFEKRIHDRMMFELLSPKKRVNAIDRLCHGYENIICKRYMVEVKKPNSNPQELYSLLKSHGAGETCYVISFNEEIDGKEVPLLDALEQAVGFGFPSIISCILGKLAYFEAEHELGATPRYILNRD
ncbi:hypothetical protein LIT25_18470 [Bacillus sp. F19]|nr:hypothetical protein LIT25_18470 [Bacillus sp. F19]